MDGCLSCLNCFLSSSQFTLFRALVKIPSVDSCMGFEGGDDSTTALLARDTGEQVRPFSEI